MPPTMAFPLEIVEYIVRAADPETRRHLLTVSRTFQAATERCYSNWDRRTFRPDTDVEHFLAMYTGHRVFLLRHVSVRVYFPMLRHTREEPLACRETVEELQDRNEEFTWQIREVFGAIKALEGRGAAKINLTIENPFQGEDGNKYCDHRRHCSWRLQLLDPETLPVLSSVRMLTIGSERGYYGNRRLRRPLDMVIVSNLLVKLPNLDALYCDYIAEDWPYPYEYDICAHFKRPWEGPWRDTRHAFGTAIMADAVALPVKIKHVRLFFGNLVEHVDIDQRKFLPNLVAPMAYDPFSTALRMLSQRVKDFHVRGCIDSSAFWPSAKEIEQGATLPTWPELSTIRVQFLPTLPSGAWYFQGPGGEGKHARGFQINGEHYPPMQLNDADEEQDRIWEDRGGRYENLMTTEFRIAPNDENIESLLESFANALGRMPVLEKAELSTFLRWDPDEDLEEAYPDLEPVAEKFYWGVTCRAEAPRIEWQVGDWRPSERVREMFRRNVGREGKEVEEEWLPLEMGKTSW